MLPEAPSNTQHRVVVAYFGSTADAQSALDELIYSGFEPNQIGAAFRSTNAADTRSTEMNEIGSDAVHRAMDSDTVGSGPASDTRAVTPAGLSTGSGSVISGAGRPGPIPGSDIPHHHSAPPAQTGSPARDPLPATGGFHETRTEKGSDESWWQKLKNFFSGDTPSESRRKGVASETSANFGTGEGHLAAYPAEDSYTYSASAFEGAFSGMGVPQSHARSLVSDLQRGGAIVSVNAEGRVDEAERILERNFGRVRYESVAEYEQWSDIPGERVRVFGQISHTYPNHLTESNASARKAS
jgi:hypothetical protein